MVAELSFTGPRVSPEGIRFEGYDEAGPYRFVLPREVLAALSGRRPRLRDQLPIFQRWRAHIYAVAERLAGRCDGRTRYQPLMITDELLLSTPLAADLDDGVRLRTPSYGMQ